MATHGQRLRRQVRTASPLKHRLRQIITDPLIAASVPKRWPDRVEIGTTFEIIVEISNVGSTDISYDLFVMLGGVQVARRDGLSIGAGETNQEKITVDGGRLRDVGLGLQDIRVMTAVNSDLDTLASGDVEIVEASSGDTTDDTTDDTTNGGSSGGSGDIIGDDDGDSTTTSGSVSSTTLLLGGAAVIALVALRGGALGGGGGGGGGRGGRR